MMRRSVAFVLVLLLTACASPGSDQPVQGLAAAQPGLDFDGAAVAAPGRGLFGLLAGGSSPSDTPAVARGATLPFGQVAKVCGLSGRDLGKVVDRAEGWRLHDPAPATNGPRTQYLSGFSDRCARQFTGALVLFGAPDVHEATRYAASNTRAYTAIDTAYEQAKSRICGVGSGTHCPANRTGRLNKAVRFVTIYPQFGATTRFELLLVNGDLAAQGIADS